MYPGNYSRTRKFPWHLYVFCLVFLHLNLPTLNKNSFYKRLCVKFKMFKHEPTSCHVCCKIVFLFFNLFHFFCILHSINSVILQTDIWSLFYSPNRNQFDPIVCSYNLYAARNDFIIVINKSK